MSIRLQIKRLDPMAAMPVRSTRGAAGLDLYAHRISWELTDQGFVETVGSGLAFEIPEGHVGLLFPRSSIAGRRVRMANSVGVIDSDYRGEVMAKFVVAAPVDLSPLENEDVGYLLGERFAQLVVVPIPTVEIEEVSDLSYTARGEGGFGSTGTGEIK